MFHVKKYHILYRTTNLITGQFYIGAHSTNNLQDGYIGSGSKLKDAIKLFGEGLFSTEILAQYQSREFLAQAEYFEIKKHLGEPLCYNLIAGGAIAIIRRNQKPVKPKSNFDIQAWLWGFIQKNLPSTIQDCFDAGMSREQVSNILSNVRA